MAKSEFVHLHVHSHYSLLDGLGKVDQLVKKAVDQGAKALALTDHGVLHGAIDFYLECQKAGIKPIVGVEAYVAPRRLADKTAGVDARPYHLLLLAKNFEGYRNLIKLTTKAHLEGYYYKPRLDRDILSRHSQGLIAATACLASETSRQIQDKNWDGLQETVQAYREIFGRDNYYLELQHHPSIPEQQVVNTHIRDLAAKTNLPLIVTNDVHYLNSEDSYPHDILVCIQTGKLVEDKNRLIYAGDFSMKTAAAMAEAFPDLPEALENTVKIASRVDLRIPLGQNLLPDFPLPKGETEDSYLKKLVKIGLRQRYQEVTTEIEGRLNYELATIKKTGFSGYLLIVADMVNFARSRNIYLGPGRGSAAGSLISYILGITNVDPLKYGLLFERFLDLNRISMPDIDLDFEDTRRGEVINYLKEKYGADHVAGIITFGTIMARAAVRDVARVLGITYSEADRIAKLVPPPVQGRHIPLETSVREAPELKTAYQSEPQTRQLLDTAMRLEGTIRHASQHACAIVISKEPLDEYVPVQESQGGDIHQVTQYSMIPIEKIGLLKMDLLGLANLTIMHQATEIIAAVYGEKIEINALPLDDQKTYELLARGESTGVFQLESSGMKRYIKELKPTQFADIIAMVALYRPGPMQWIESFINRKNGREQVSYLHPLAESAFRETYGIPVYQEQVMQMSKDMCGFTGPEADTLRKAIGKKIPKLMKEMKAKFIAGAKSKGVSQERAEAIFRQLEDFAAYCFNKSHATCYALIAYQTAYLKTHYPDCFMAALMTSDLHNIDRISIEIGECERLGLKVLPPDVNESFADFAVIKDSQAIRFGLGAIKNVGESVAREIVSERKTNGPYQTLEDFLARLGRELNKKVLESLVKSGTLDRFADRNNLFAGLELLVKYAAGVNHHAAQISIFDRAGGGQQLAKLKLPSVPADSQTYLNWEKELLGLYLSDHPLKSYQSILEPIVSAPISELTETNRPVRLAGIIQSMKKITTKSNQSMAFGQLEDLSGSLEAVFFPTIFQSIKDFLIAGAIIVVEGKIVDKDGALKVLVDKGWPIDQVSRQSFLPLRGATKSADKGDKKPPPGNFTIVLPERADRQLVNRLKALLETYPGQTPVELRLAQDGTIKALKLKLAVSVKPELRQAVGELLDSL